MLGVEQGMLPPIETLRRIDTALSEQRRSRRWLSLEIGRSPSYVGDLFRSSRIGGPRLPPLDELTKMSIALKRPLSYFIGIGSDGFDQSQTAATIEVNRDLLIKAQTLAERLDTNSVVRAQAVVAFYAAFLTAKRDHVVVTDEWVKILTSAILSLIAS